METPLFKTNTKEKIFLLVTIILYSIVGFWNLGTTEVPETYYVVDAEHPAPVFELGETPTSFVFHSPFNDMTKYIGIQILGSADGENWEVVYSNANSDDYTAAMRFYSYELTAKAGMRYFKVDKLESSTRLPLSEVGFYDTAGDLLSAQPVNAGAELCLDEQDKLQKTITRENSAYFDESYFGPSFVEMAGGQPVAEMDHPPVGRLIIGIGITLFGTNMLGMRVMQVLFGVMMLPPIYFFVRRLLKSEKWGALAVLLLALDFLHYTQTRIATLDAFLVFFILAMYACLYFFHVSVGRGRRFAFLFLSGLCFGLGVGTKWSAAYGALGLAFLYFLWLFIDLRRGDRALRKERLGETLWCVFCFVLLPLATYVLSYIPYVNTLADKPSLITGVVDHTRQMLSYHTGDATHFEHAYSSRWWTWFLALKPVFYFYQQQPAEIYIYGTGNPLVWGMGLIGVVFALCRALGLGEDRGLVIAAGYFSQLLPWTFISRDTFLYHYFPMVPFLVIGAVYLFKETVKSPELAKIKNWYLIAFVILAAAGFVIAFPFLYGLATTWTEILFIRKLLLVIFGVMAALWLGLIAWELFQQRKPAEESATEGEESEATSGDEQKEK